MEIDGCFLTIECSGVWTRLATKGSQTKLAIIR